MPKSSTNLISQYSSDRRILIAVALLLITPLGILSKKYTGIGQAWVQDYSGDVLYEIFWCLVIFWFARHNQELNKLKQNSFKIALGVFIATCVIEVSQLWFHLVPEAIRSSFLWRMTLGAGFAWWDFPHYALGSLLGYWLLCKISEIGTAKRSHL